MAQIWELAAAEIVEDDSILSRPGIHEPTLGDYEERLRLGEELPPIVVFCEDGVHGPYWLADGRHRKRAREKLDQQTLDVLIRKGNKSAARWFSACANLEHGLRPTAKDRRHAVKNIVLDPAHAKRSAVEIGARCGVGHATVSRIKVELGLDATVVATKTTPSGEKTSYTLPPAGQGKKAKASGKAPKIKREKDKRGRLVPEWLEVIAKGSTEIDKLCTEVSELILSVEERSRLPVGVSLKGEVSYLLGLLKEIRKKVRGHRFYEVCDACNTPGAKGPKKACKDCGGKGWRSEVEYHEANSGGGE